jgi:hypothetical protein
MPRKMPRRLRHASMAATNAFSTAARSSAVTSVAPLLSPSSLVACAAACRQRTGRVLHRLSVQGLHQLARQVGGVHLWRSIKDCCCKLPAADGRVLGCKQRKSMGL